MKTESVRYSP